MATLDGLVWWAALVLSAAAIAYRLLALAAVGLWRPVESPGWPRPPRVTLLKPLCGPEDGLEEALVSFLSQRVTSPVRFVFGVAQADDPALAVAKDVAARFPECDVALVVEGQNHGGSPKVGNLINMAKGGLSEVVVTSDSDIVIRPGVLQQLIDALSAPGYGAVTSLYQGRPDRSGDRLRTFGAWYLNYWSLPMAAVHARLGGLNVTYSPLTAIRGEVLAQGGGFAAIAWHMTDDAALGRLVLGTGWKLGFAPNIVETMVNDASPRMLFDHERRWSQTDRSEHPVGNLATIVSHPGPVPLLLLLNPGWLAALGIALPVLLRWLIARLVEHRFGRPETCSRMGLAGTWLRDLVCFAVWIAGMTSSRVDWRGNRFAMARGGRLVEVGDSA